MAAKSTAEEAPVTEVGVRSARDMAQRQSSSMDTADVEQPARAERQTEEDVPPDGGFGWVCVLCNFFINGHTWGVNSTYGVFLGYYLSHDFFPGTTALTYAFIGGLSISMAMVVAPLATHVIHVYGTWTCLHLGILLETLALLGASFSKQKYQIILSQGICFGWGMGLLFTGSVGIIPQWFSKKRSIANAIAAGGSGCGAMIYSLASQRAIDTVGLPWCFRILAICTLVVNLIACNVVRDRNQQTGARHVALDMAILKRPEFLLVQAWSWFSMFAYIIVVFSIPAYARAVGLSSSQGAILNAILNVGQMVGRPVIGLISDRYGRINVAMISSFGAALTVFCFWIPVEAVPSRYGLLLFYSVVGGALAGNYWATMPPVVAEVVGLADMPAALSLTWLSISPPTTLAEPIALELRQENRKSWVYLHAQIFTAFMFSGAALCLWVLRGWKIGELEVVSATRTAKQRPTPEISAQVKSEADIDGPVAVLPQDSGAADRIGSHDEARRSAWKSRDLFRPLAIVQAAFALDGQYSPFSDPLLARSDDELLLVRRQDGCQSSYKSCTADGSNTICCPDESNCTRDTAGNVACCPTSALCTGVITTTTADTSLSLTTTTSGVVISSSTTSIESTITTTLSSAAQLPTSGVQGGGSTVPNTFFPFVYIPTSYANANLCLSAYSYCQSQSTSCAESLAGYGVTVSDSGGDGITIVGASTTTLNPCTYLAVPQKKGPKSFRAKVISEIRDAQQLAPILSPTKSAGNEQSSPFDFNGSVATAPYGPTPGILPQQTIDICIDAFFECFYPTYPIFKRQKLVDRIQAGDTAEPEFYCFVASICALTIVQTAVKVPVPAGIGESKEGDRAQNRRGYAISLIQEVLRVRKSVDYIEHPTLLTVQTSFFLFSSYFGLEKQNACWFHLRESATISQMLGMHEEATYAWGDMAENVYKRRTYWLILVTERAYAVERHKPLSLYSSIALPVAEGADEEIVNGLLYLVSLLHCIDDKFMSFWNKVDNDCSTAWVSALQRRLLNALPAELKTTKYQAADIRITQHWLRAVVWQLSIMNGNLSSSSADSALTFKYPIEIAEALQSDLQKMDLPSMEVHGIGLIEKLFDMACTLIDVIACVPLDSSASGASPHDVFKCYLDLITQLHGGTSRYLPLLLAKVSDNLPSVAAPVQHTTPAIKQGYAGASDNMPTPAMPQDYGDYGARFGVPPPPNLGQSQNPRMADDTLEDDRIIELSSIAAIFPEIYIDPSNPYHASLDLAVTPLQPLRIKFHQPTGDGRRPHLPGPTTALSNGGQRTVGSGPNTGPEDVHVIEHLPPLKLDILLRPGYPASEPPVVHLVTDSPWLRRNKLQELELACTRLWDEVGRDQVVFSYIDYLLQQAEDAFGLAGGDGVVSLSPDLRLALLDFDRRIRRQKFEQETFDCGVCLEPKKGKDCHRLLHCGHVFCTSCLTDFYTSCITEGDVDSVKCMDPKCGKHGNDGAVPKPKGREPALNPSELLQIPLSQELVQRYVRLKRKKKLESSKNTIYCPRQWCQGPAYPEYRKKKAEDDFHDFSDTEDSDCNIIPASSEELRNLPMNQRLAICSDCSYAFCFVCRKTWHGSHLSAAVLCNPRDPALLAAEEQASLEYLKKHSTPCPTCNAPAQKTMGCNHMICFRCKTHFCYLCACYLMEDNPFAHFNDMRSTCHMRLWELEGGDGADAENHRAEVGDEEEAAPDVLRHRRGERAIEFINFAANAGGGVDGRRINIPDDEDDERASAAPLPVPAAPRRNQRGRGQQANPPGQNNDDTANPAPARAMGLERFLELALLDAEDEWDSDELDDDDIWGEQWDVHDDFQLPAGAGAGADTRPVMAAPSAAVENVEMGRHGDEPDGRGFVRGGGQFGFIDFAVAMECGYEGRQQYQEQL
ncbi:hypothetical protein DV737_g2996, partial [Chaetothyriales sp. CBS 132003]